MSPVSPKIIRPGSRRLNLLLKFLLVLLTAAVWYFEVRSRGDLLEIYTDFTSRLRAAAAVWLWAALLLVPLNWWFETQKWRVLIREFEPLSQGRAYLAVLAGVSISLFTPNRIGEYAGRIVFVRKSAQWKAAMANMVGNYAQFLVIFLAGFGGLFYHLGHFYPAPPAAVVPYGLLLVFLASACLVWLYFHLGILAPLIRRIPFLHHFKRFVKDLLVVRRFSAEKLAAVAAWAVLRYLTYKLQYFCLLHYFGIETGVLAAFSGIAALFLLQSSIPLPPVSGLIMRGNLAVFLWGHYGANEVSALATTFALLIINLILPSLIGIIALLRTDIAQSLGYEDDETN